MIDDTPNKVTAILQGRTGSTRLPGKVTLPLAGKPVILHVYDRILYCRNIDRIIVATTTKKEDDGIARLFNDLKVTVFRGSEKDPLDRYYQAAVLHGVKHIVRIMADCPLLDPEVIDDVITMYFNRGYDFCYLGGEFPVGLDTTVFSFNALLLCWRNARRISEREHIFLYMIHNPEKFNSGVLEQHKGLLHHRWVMDYDVDYQFIKAVYDALYEPGKLFLTRDVLNLLKAQPQLLKINTGIPRDEGIRKAMEREQNSP